MTVVATITLAEAPARALAAAIEGDDVLWTRSLDLSETALNSWQIAIYFEDEPDAAERAALARLGGKQFAINPLPDADWVAKSLEGLAPVRAGRFLVHGGHDRGKVRANDLAIEIEAGLAFGTGHHGTTTGCLLAIERVANARPIRNALDVGTGSGVLATAIAKRVHCAVLASDMDPVAVQVARRNVRLNGAARLVRTVTAAGLNHPEIEARVPYDLIVANILAGPLVALAPAIRKHLARGGTVILSGLLTEQGRRVAATYRGQGIVSEATIVRGEWTTLILRG
jgi:ribosomal protein L11 methyltransferase